MAYSRGLLKVSFLSCFLLLSACTKGGGGGEGGGGSDNVGREPQNDNGSFRTNCGTVLGSSLKNPVDSKDGELVPVEVVSSNLVIVTSSQGKQLIKLHGIESSDYDYQERGAINTLRQLAAGGAYFFQADKSCTTSVPGGGTGTFGQLFSKNGVSFSEKLLSLGYVSADSDPCGGGELYSCYQALEEDISEQIAGELDRLLWKPVSDSNGNLAIHTGPSGTTVIVNGETGVNQGGGNGYGSLARFSRPGCSYGANVNVRVVDSSGRAYLFNGQPSISIPSGCNRYCLDGGNLAQCYKS